MPAPAPLRDLPGVTVIDDPDRLLRYEIPERGTPGHAACALVPDTEAALGVILSVCNLHDLTLVISAGRTGLVEAQRPEGESVLSLERLNRPLRLAAGTHVFEFPQASPEACADALATWWRATGAPVPNDATITVQAGLSIDALNQIVAPLSLMFPMEMGSTSAATVGACVANASAGANAVCYGTAAHMCETAAGFWGSGAPSGPCRAGPWSAIDPQRLAIDSAAIRPAWGLIGAQGVLGVITQATLRLLPLPQQREAAMVPVADMRAAANLLRHAAAAFPGSLEEFEFMSREAIDLVRQHKGDAFRLPFTHDELRYAVLLQVKSAAPAEADDLAARLYQFLSNTMHLSDDAIGYGPLRALKEIRHSITECSNRRMRQRGGGRLSFDTATPLAVFGPYLDELAERVAADWPGVEFVAFGHAGVGGAHLHLLGSAEHPVSAHQEALTALVFDVTQRYGGTFSAEHGVGPKWGAEFARRASPATLAATLAAKRLRDPRNVLNPRSFALDRLLALP